LKHWGVIAAVAALAGATAPARADEGSVSAALRRHNLSSVVGLSSYYGAAFHGRRTADGERFDMFGLSAANKSLPIPCYARVTNLGSGRSVVVRVNDRGPYIRGRILDVSERVAHLLHFHGGLARVRLDYLGKAGPADAREQQALLASLKTGDELVAVARAKPELKTGSDEGVTVAERNAPALAYSGSAPAASAPAAAALAAAVRPMAAAAPLSVAAKLDASMRRLESSLESAHQAALDAGRRTAERAARTLSPYGSLVIAPFKSLIEASR
jgi:rare lipoprotein A